MFGVTFGHYSDSMRGLSSQSSTDGTLRAQETSNRIVKDSEMQCDVTLSKCSSRVTAVIKRHCGSRVALGGIARHRAPSGL